jgi:DNA-directed RNA polymerase subunit omega
VARITIEDCLEKVPSRFQLVHMAAKRVRQIREGSEYLVSSPKNEDIVVALREIAAGKVRAKTAGLEIEEGNETPEIAETLETEETKETQV